MLELNRDHYLMIGVVLLLAGVQLRYVDTYVLNEKTSEFLAKQLGSEKDGAVAQGYFFLAPEQATIPKRSLQPPPWLGWSLLSIGAVLTLHSLALKKPEG